MLKDANFLHLEETVALLNNLSYFSYSNQLFYSHLHITIYLTFLQKHTFNEYFIFCFRCTHNFSLKMFTTSFLKKCSVLYWLLNKLFKTFDKFCIKAYKSKICTSNMRFYTLTCKNKNINVKYIFIIRMSMYNISFFLHNFINFQPL